MKFGSRIVSAAMDLLKIAPCLELDDSGWWRSRELSPVAYPEDGNAFCYAVEDSSFWFQHRNRCIVETAEQFPPLGTIFDIGGGNGCVARAIQDADLEVVVVEPGLRGVQNSLKRGIKYVVRAALQDIDLMSESLPAVGLFDVVEHIEDDIGFMTGVNRLLVPGGRVYITVPAYQWLWSYEDVVAGHSRRYTKSTLGRLLAVAGYAVEFVTYFFEFLLLPILLSRVLPYRLGAAHARPSLDQIQSDHHVRSSLIASVLEEVERSELRKIARRCPMKWGTSILAVARKIENGVL